jgi:CheY-like chemotaxis protein
VLDTGFDGLRLLLVEDEYLLALYLSEMLEDLGAQVLGPVASVADALELIDKAPEIDAAILDVNLAGEAVFPVADRLRAPRAVRLRLRLRPRAHAAALQRRHDLPEAYRRVGGAGCARSAPSRSLRS